MKQLLTILTVLAAVVLITSCQKDLPDNLKNIDVNQGGMTPSPTPTPDNPTQQGDIPAEEDNPWPRH